MSTYDEQEIERLFKINEELRQALRKMQYQLGTAEVLLSVSVCNTPDTMSRQIWENRKKQWQKEYSE